MESVQETIAEGSHLEVFVRGLLPLALYQIRVAAENMIGKSPWSETLIVTTDEEGKSIRA